MKGVVIKHMIEEKIYLIRGKRVMIDRDLAQLYGVRTKALNQAVKRNTSRFPDDFMLQLNEEEMKNWRSQFVTSKSENSYRKLSAALKLHLDRIVLLTNGLRTVLNNR
ncbi:MAG: hypothetical protein COV74_02950 [Candidatus Omnitrophica bacterium CG11_big_fil_rev_8_21_14_0_20_45_26]|uniref:KilA-N DNA-binding domain-containing protein n=1 Tax=Candidatus Abzuiibacterium crystallinum TaxID=1974748 RepID=A0A2H0LT97_9BACT|nr:MAG: hypothetical protein COV74_02950 [Candidatus Omnitrophica bacterium CG11_big_fil_rev_8_21_14_0_20_45_26]PIW65522.1 MAG: hypothetical protein COW12_01645 [Candidatus Omnitrophica bacterium CG12_big_fil_rev_8_21_14_0_65_45_16]